MQAECAAIAVVYGGCHTRSPDHASPIAPTEFKHLAQLGCHRGLGARFDNLAELLNSSSLCLRPPRP